MRADFPPGLMKNMDKLPASNPHKKAYVAQQDLAKAQEANGKLTEQNQDLQQQNGLLSGISALGLIGTALGLLNGQDKNNGAIQDPEEAFTLDTAQAPNAMNTVGSRLNVSV